MANIYVRSTTGNDANSGASWALAKATLGGAAAIGAAGDTIYVSQAHAENNTTYAAMTFAGTLASPVRIVCANDSAEPPTAAATTGIVHYSGLSTWQIAGHIFVYGLKLLRSAQIFMMLGANTNAQVYENCQFELGPGASSIYIPLSSATNDVQVAWINCTLNFAGASANGIVVSSGHFRWQGGSFVPGTKSPASLISPFGGVVGYVLIENVDLSALAATINIAPSTITDKTIVLRNCKLPVGWTGQPITGTPNATCRVEMYNCDSADTNYRIWIKEARGELRQETTIVRSGGASDGTTSYAWRINTTANCQFAPQEFKTPEIVRWNDSVGAPVTVTVEIVHDSLTALKDDEIWLEVCYLGTSGYPLGVLADDRKTDFPTTAFPQGSSSATWDTGGFVNPNRQKLSVTFTPRKKGFLHARVCVAKASYSVFVDPVVTVS